MSGHGVRGEQGGWLQEVPSRWLRSLTSRAFTRVLVSVPVVVSCDDERPKICRGSAREENLQLIIRSENEILMQIGTA